MPLPFTSTVTIQRLIPTPDGNMGSSYRAVPIATRRCYVEQMGANEIGKYRAAGMSVDWKIIFPRDPGISGTAFQIIHGGDVIRVAGVWVEPPVSEFAGDDDLDDRPPGDCGDDGDGDLDGPGAFSRVWVVVGVRETSRKDQAT